MSWIFRYRCRVFLRSSLCAIPIACMAAALLAAPLLREIDLRTHWTLLGFGPDGSKMVVGALASSLLTFIVFFFSIILLAVQIASGQLSPRIIARVLESLSQAVTRRLGLFVHLHVSRLRTHRKPVSLSSRPRRHPFESVQRRPVSLPDPENRPVSPSSCNPYPGGCRYTCRDQRPVSQAVLAGRSRGLGFASHLRVGHEDRHTPRAVRHGSRIRCRGPRWRLRSRLVV